MNNKIIGNICSYKRTNQLIKTLDSIYEQFDVINLFLNDFADEFDDFFFRKKINLHLTNNDLGDGYKFNCLNESNGYFFTLDDDLIYPPNYVSYMINKIEQYNKEKIITLHGRSFIEFPIKSYYNTKSIRKHFLEENLTDEIVQVGGTGVMAFHTETLKFKKNEILIPNMADIWITKFSKEKNIDIVCVKHSKNFIIQQNINNSIYDNSIKNDNKQTVLINSIFGYKSITLSIVIPTYGNSTMLSECLNSIQTNNDYEILVGIDGCQETLDYVKNNKFNENIKLFYFEKNVGPYIVKNSLSNIASSDILLFFDSDDIMKENMIPEILEKMKTNEFVKPMYVDFTIKKNPNINKTNTYGEGVFAIKKELFLSMNGFEPWPVAADSDFMARLYKNKIKFQYTDNVVFYRRIHPNSLTQSEETGLSSKLRGKYFLISKNKTNFNPLPKLVTSDFYEVFTEKEYKSDTIIPIVELPILKDITPILKNEKTIDYDRINDVLNKNNTKTQIPQTRISNPPNNRNEINQNKTRILLAKESIKKR